jgi:hypothetical protein
MVPLPVFETMARVPLLGITTQQEAVCKFGTEALMMLRMPA